MKISIYKFIHKLIYIACNKFLSFTSDRKAVAAIEFAFLVPVMSLAWLGLSILSETINANRKASLFAYSVGDMISQSTEIDQNLLINIYNSSASIVWPFQFDRITVSLVSIISDGGNKQHLAWANVLGDKNNAKDDFGNNSNCRNMSNWPMDSIVKEVPGNYIYVISEIIYAPTITSTIIDGILGGYFENGKKTISEKFYVRPRYSDVVKFPNNECKANPFSTS